MKKIIADTRDYAWRLKPNKIWNVPEDVNQVHFEMETFGPWNILRKAKALVIDLDGNIYGVRAASRVSNPSYHIEGTVSISGKKVKVFSSSKLFYNSKNELVDVAVFVLYASEKEKLV